MSEEADRLIQAMHEYISPILSSLAGGAVGYFATRKRNEALAGKYEDEGDAAKLNAITKQFEILIDGYETRVADLVREIDSLRAEVLALRKALDDRPKQKEKA